MGLGMMDKVKQFVMNHIDSNDSRYIKLILIVGKSGSGKTMLMNELSTELNVNIQNVNLILSRELLEVTLKKRPLVVQKLFVDLFEKQENYILLDNLEILFEPSLQCNPVNMLKNLSRNNIVISTWNGTYNNDKLTYAEQGHKEYGQFDIDGIFLVTMDGQTFSNQKI